MKNISFLILLLLSFNCLSQETTLDCSGKGQRQFKDKVEIEYEHEFLLYFDEQKNAVHLSEYGTMCDAVRVLSGSKFTEQHDIDKKTIEYSCVVSYYLSDRKHIQSDKISINRATGKFTTYAMLVVDKIPDITFNTSKGTCKKVSSQF